MARIPHDFGSWLGYGHSIPNGDPAEPYAPGVPFAGALLIPPFALPDLFAVEGDPPIHIYQLLPVTPGEMALKLQLGLDGALEQMEARDPGLYGPIDLGRPTAG